MAYDPYSAVNAIYKLKGQWRDSNKAGDTVARDSAAEKAQQYYEQLKNNGYNDVAEQLTAANYKQAKSINDKWAKTGKTPTRDYLYSLGKSQGMTSKDIDKLIGWDNQTGEVSFGGKKIGTPDVAIDGVSYWSDTSVLDNAFNDYLNRSNTSRSKSTAVDQENEKLFSKYNQEYEDLKNTNPFETETGKAILAKYDLAGLQGRDNEVASGAGSNGGNIDSFAAANALRQQSTLINQGQMAALDAYQQKLDHARALLSDMGVNIDRVYNQDETSKNNDVARKSEIAGVTGYVPNEWALSSNPYMNSDGTIKDQFKNTDFAAIMNKAKASGDTAAYNAAAAARFYKIMGNYGAYGKYDNGNYIVPGATPTETHRQFDAQLNAQTSAADKDRAQTWEQFKAQIEQQNKDRDETRRQFDVTTGQQDKDRAQTWEQFKAQIEQQNKDRDETARQFDAQISAYNSPSYSSGSSSSRSGSSGGSSSSRTSSSGTSSGRTSSSGTSSNYTSSGGSASAKPTLTASQAASAIKNGVRSQTVIDAYNYYYGTNYTEDTLPKPTSLTDKQVEEWATKINSKAVDKNGGMHTAIQTSSNRRGTVNTYSVVPGYAEFVAMRVLESDELTDAQKEYLLFNKFGISPTTVNNMLKDPHYRN